ncbi:hypothetical protein EIP86_001976 [Pleurotus ostreatoroseus]|nr:hypothetical protein EIP86_001976 [Pleurotus ostreatoroseus]
MLFQELGACTSFFVSEIFMLTCTFTWVPRESLAGRPHSRRAEQYLDTVKMRKLARSAAWALPMLAIVHFKIETPQGERETYWTFNNDGSPVEWPADQHRAIQHIDAAFELAAEGKGITTILFVFRKLMLDKERITTEAFDEFLRGLIDPENSLWDRLGSL